jgi:hypothetical protein
MTTEPVVVIVAMTRATTGDTNGSPANRPLDERTPRDW